MDDYSFVIESKQKVKILLNVIQYSDAWIQNLVWSNVRDSGETTWLWLKLVKEADKLLVVQSFFSLRILKEVPDSYYDCFFIQTTYAQWKVLFWTESVKMFSCPYGISVA